ncbi:MAG: hypothetical protein NZ951_06795 [Dehalococcoidia bacterium]|nr:hypothetical protein [Dehalococcoidia bacterium]MDW8120563.1 hypothetical protein [Chloroflexota bacterium]
MSEQVQTLEASPEPVQKALGEAQARITHLEGEVARLREENEALRHQVRQALARYRALLVAQAPEVPEDLVQGDTVEAVDESFARARALVERVRRQVEASLQKERVAGGAPPRQGISLDALPPSEKIRLGLQRLLQQS